MTEHNTTGQPSSISRLTMIREIEDVDDQLLIDNGWEFAGVGLFSHAILSGGRKQKCFTKEQALQQNHKVIGKCTMCGVGIEEFWCPPTECKCLYGINFKLRGNQQ